MTENEATRIPEARRAKCEFCPDVVDVEAFGICQFTKGWVLRRQGGGGHGVSLAEHENRWAHGRCVERQAARLRDQGTLW